MGAFHFKASRSATGSAFSEYVDPSSGTMIRNGCGHSLCAASVPTCLRKTGTWLFASAFHVTPPWRMRPPGPRPCVATATISA